MYRVHYFSKILFITVILVILGVATTGTVFAQKIIEMEAITDSVEKTQTKLQEIIPDKVEDYFATLLAKLEVFRFSQEKATNDALEKARQRKMELEYRENITTKDIGEGTVVIPDEDEKLETQEKKSGKLFKARAMVILLSIYHGIYNEPYIFYAIVVFLTIILLRWFYNLVLG